MRHVSLLESEKNGKATWRLLGPDGHPIAAFSVFADSLLRQHSVNTRTAYCRHLAEFIDYLYEATLTLATMRPGFVMTKGVLEEVIESYHEYLVHGCDSGNEIAVLVDKNKPSPRHSVTTSGLKHAPVRRFLQLSEQVREQALELTTVGVSNDAVDVDRLMNGIGAKVPISPSQRSAMLATSMIAGVIAGGPKLLKNTVLPTVQPQVHYDETRAFPFDSMVSFISAMPTYRDKTLYALLAASGCRIHEALQLLFDDIDINAGKVLLVDPKARPNHKSYLALTPIERDRLAWKGRTTDATLLIEPFATMFFSFLAEYMRHEYIPHGRHQFVFQYLKSSRVGEPYFLSRADSRLETFRKAVVNANIESAVRGPHSLRHAYGTYLLNYFPRSNGSYGLPMPFVQQLMGHADQKSTMKYARYDRDLMEIELRHANALIFSSGTPKTLAQLRLDALNQKVGELEREMGVQHQTGRIND
jgi:integrase